MATLTRKNKLLIALALATFFIILSGLSPAILPPNYSHLPEHERLLVESAINSALNHLDFYSLLVLRMDLVKLSKAPCFEHHLLIGEPWEVRLRAYTFFYIPLYEVRVFVDGGTLNPLCGSIRPAGYKWADCDGEGP